MKKPANGNLLKTFQVCEMLGVSDETLTRWRKSGKIKNVVKVGKENYYSLKEIKALFEYQL